jgi:GNAT superfamily N-acetyltransferase
MLELLQINEEGQYLEEVRTLFKEYEKELGENLCFQDFENELSDPLKKYGAPTGALYIALWNEEPAGCIALTALKEKGVCEMKRLYVKPAYRQFKIGRALVEQVLFTAINTGYHTMKLDTLQKLLPAIELYKKAGFTETNAYYKNPLTNVVYMEKQLC